MGGRKQPQKPAPGGSRASELLTKTPLQRAQWMVARAEGAVDQAPPYATAQALGRLQDALDALAEIEAAAAEDERRAAEEDVDALDLVLELLEVLPLVDVEVALIAAERRLRPHQPTGGT